MRIDAGDWTTTQTRSCCRYLWLEQRMWDNSWGVVGRYFSKSGFNCTHFLLRISGFFGRSSSNACISILMYCTPLQCRFINCCKAFLPFDHWLLLALVLQSWFLCQWRATRKTTGYSRECKEVNRSPVYFVHCTYKMGSFYDSQHYLHRLGVSKFL